MQIVKKLDIWRAFRRIEKHSGNLRGPDGMNANAFKNRFRKECNGLHSDYNDGTYEFGPIRFIKGRDKKGKPRKFAIQNIRDRIVSSLLAESLKNADDDLIDSVVAYRKGSSLFNVVREIETTLNE